VTCLIPLGIDDPGEVDEVALDASSDRFGTLARPRSLLGRIGQVGVVVLVDVDREDPVGSVSCFGLPLSVSRLYVRPPKPSSGVIVKTKSPL
jgi:hypothetical protein